MIQLTNVQGTLNLKSSKVEMESNIKRSKQDSDVLVPNKLKQRVEHLVRLNESSRALDLLSKFANQEHLINLEENPEAMKDLQDKHPKHNAARDVLPVKPNGIEPLHLTTADLLKAIMKTHRGSSAGLASWTSEVLKQLVHYSDEFLEQLCILANMVVGGKGGPPEIWTCSLLLGIAKKPTGVRPISVGSVLYRVLVGKPVASRMFEKCENIFAPLQFGVGIKGGAEKIVSAVDLIAQEIIHNDRSTMIVFAIDGINAFNTISRRQIANFLHANQELHPIIPLYHYSYGNSTPLFGNNGIKICDSETGVRQGDPMGCLFYCCGLQSSLLEIDRKFSYAEIMAFLDDLTCAIPACEFNRFYKGISKILLDNANYQIDEAKCQIFCNENTLQNNLLQLPVDCKIKVSTEGIKILGAPVGKKLYVNCECTNIGETSAKIIPHILDFKKNDCG
jgi:hypothetical protein